jgi:hypothetical protein
MPRILAAILLVAVLAIGGGVIATTAYQAGLSTAVTTAGDTAAVVTPVVVPAYGYGWGWHAGFGFFGRCGLRTRFGGTAGWSSAKTGLGSVVIEAGVVKSLGFLMTLTGTLIR